MTHEEIEEMKKVCELQVSEFLYSLAERDLNLSADYLDDMAERLQGMAITDRKRARNRAGFRKPRVPETATVLADGPRESKETD